jgi:hypothetical protein
MAGKATQRVRRNEQFLIVEEHVTVCDVAGVVVAVLVRVAVGHA